MIHESLLLIRTQEARLAVPRKFSGGSVYMDVLETEAASEIKADVGGMSDWNVIHGRFACPDLQA
jgi:hypothetical protein